VVGTVIVASAVVLAWVLQIAGCFLGLICLVKAGGSWGKIDWPLLAVAAVLIGIGSVLHYL
jgi:hypothetical protein